MNVHVASQSPNLNVELRITNLKLPYTESFNFFDKRLLWQTHTKSRDENENIVMNSLTISRSRMLLVTFSATSARLFDAAVVFGSLSFERFGFLSGTERTETWRFA